MNQWSEENNESECKRAGQMVKLHKFMVLNLNFSIKYLSSMYLILLLFFIIFLFTITVVFLISN